MTYAGFLAVFVVPVIVVGALRHRAALRVRRPALALLLPVVYAAAPWDRAAVAWGLWSFPVRAVQRAWLVAADGIAIRAGIRRLGEGTRTGWAVADVPVEEIAFFALGNALVANGVLLRDGRRRPA